jgi:hypothetical protein
MRAGVLLAAEGLDVATLDDAIAWAKRMPLARRDRGGGAAAAAGA